MPSEQKHPFIALADKIQAERNLTEAEAIRLAADTDQAALLDYVHKTGLAEALQHAESLRTGCDLENHEFNRLIQAKMKRTGCNLSAAMKQVVAEHPHIHASYILAAQQQPATN